MLCLLHKKCYEVLHYSVHPVHVVYAAHVCMNSEQATDVFIFWKIFYFVTTILPFYT